MQIQQMHLIQSLFLFIFLTISNLSYANTDFPSPQPPFIQAMNPQDPYESYNRSIFKFNMAFNDAIGAPVAKSYNRVVPDPIKKGFSNFFNNLKEPLSMINALLQGKPKEGLSTLMRFAINSTFGLFGLLDIGTPAGLNEQDEDLGQTLAVWGVWENSNFIMLPFLGPFTTRELVGGTIDSVYNPVYPYVIDTNLNGRSALYLGGKFIDYTKIVNLTSEMNQQPDPYIFMRESYLQHRTNLIYDGHPPQPPMDDFDFE